MKKLLAQCMIAIVMIACTDQSLQENEKATAAPSRRACSANEVLQANLQKDPALAARMNEIERKTTEAIRSGAIGRLNEDGKIEIPVVVNVIYRTAAQNISVAQIQSQIDVLNEDFNKTNADASSVPALFSGLATDVDIQFVLEAVNRRSSNRLSWSASTDAMKKSAQGIAPTDPTHNLNLWVVNKIVDSFGDEVLGYAQFPGGNLSTDGVVIGYRYFGRTGTAVAPFNKGRTATHEVGHYLNLRHIWGDQNCGSDLVSDTPTHNTYNFGCPVFPHASTCAGRPTEMTMNYMDYTDDACMYMFTTGQKNRMLALFAPGGAREEMAE